MSNMNFLDGLDVGTKTDKSDGFKRVEGSATLVPNGKLSVVDLTLHRRIL